MDLTKLIEDRKKILLLIILLSILVLAIQPIIRAAYFDNLPSGSESYYHLRISETIMNDGLPSYDQLSYNGRSYIFDPYHILLSFSIKSFGEFPVFVVLPIILGILSSLLFYSILQKFTKNKKLKILITSIFIISPIYIYVFSVFSDFSLIIFLNLLGFYLFTKKSRIFMASIIPFALLIPFGAIHVFVTVLFLMAYLFYKKKHIEKGIIFIMLLAIASFVYFNSFNNLYGNPINIRFFADNILSRLISELGANFGLGAFTILLSIIGIIFSWEKKRLFAPIFLVLFFLVSSIFFYGKEANLYLNLLFSVFAGIAFYNLFLMKWNLKIVKNISMLLIVCGLVFSSIIAIERVSSSYPTPEIVDSLSLLKLYSEPDEIVFSHHENGFWIEYFSKRPAFTDSNFNYAPDVEQRFVDTETIFYSKNLETTYSLLSKYNISYIFITEEMKSGLVWKQVDQGLLFLFANNETFKNIYSDHDIEVWHVIRDKSQYD